MWRHRALLDQIFEIQTVPSGFILGWGSPLDLVKTTGDETVERLKILKQALVKCNDTKACAMPSGLNSDPFDLAIRLPLPKKVSQSWPALVNALSVARSSADGFNNSRLGWWNESWHRTSNLNLDRWAYQANGQFAAFSTPYLNGFLELVKQTINAVDRVSASLTEDIVEYRVSRIVRQRCQASVDDPSCIKQPQIAELRSKIAIFKPTIVTNGGSAPNWTPNPFLTSFIHKEQLVPDILNQDLRDKVLTLSVIPDGTIP
jgi:hypothetical protein